MCESYPKKRHVLLLPYVKSNINTLFFGYMAIIMGIPQSICLFIICFIYKIIA